MGNSGSSLLGCMHKQLLEKACNTCNGLLHFSIFPGFVLFYFFREATATGFGRQGCRLPDPTMDPLAHSWSPVLCFCKMNHSEWHCQGRWFDEKAVFTCVYYQRKQIVQCWVWLWKVFGALLLYIGRLIGNEAASCRSLCHDRSVTCPGCAARHWPTLYTSHWLLIGTAPTWPYTTTTSVCLLCCILTNAEAYSFNGLHL